MGRFVLLICAPGDGQEFSGQRFTALRFNKLGAAQLAETWARGRHPAITTIIVDEDRWT